MSDTDLLITCQDSHPSTSAEININVPGSSERCVSSLNRCGLLLYKWVALLLMCLLGFGSYFCYDNPGALENHFHNDMHLNKKEFMLLYTFYTWPNVILCFIGGFLMDRVFGIRLGACIYTLFVVFGQLIFAYGVYVNLFWLTLLGRFVFGIGGESLAVAQNSYAVVWFKGNVLNMVFGFQLSVARLGSSVNFWLMEPLYTYILHYFSGNQCLGIALLIASICCIVSFFSSIVLALQDKHAERFLNRTQDQSSETVKLSEVKHFPASFWLTTFTIVFYYSAIFSFVALGQDFFKTKFGLKTEKANFVNSILYTISAILSPFLGLLIDKCGKNISFVFCSLLLTIAAHLMLSLTYIDPLISMCIVGVSYSMIASALWPIIALVIPEHLLGTAYGATQSLENLGLSVVQMTSGVILHDYDYLILEMYFISCFCIALSLVLLLWMHDLKRNSGYLNMSTKQRNEYNKRLQAFSEHNEEERLLDSDYGSNSEEEQAHAVAAKNVKDVNNVEGVDENI